MSEHHCHQCGQTLPKGQSFYQDHGVFVCLECFKHSPRCALCRFPSKKLKRVSPHGMLCEFCQETHGPKPPEPCLFCGGMIPPEASHYADHGVKVCQSCFKKAPRRCFTCRFPEVNKEVPGIGGVCRFCENSTLGEETDLAPILEVLLPFVKSLGYRPDPDLKLLFTDWRLVLGMQEENPPSYPVHFFDEYVHYGLPMVYLKGTFFCLARVPKHWFLVSLAGQLVARELCKAYGAVHLQGTSPFHKLARGWVRYVSHLTATRLGQEQIKGKLERHPEKETTGDFSRIMELSHNLPTRQLVKEIHRRLGLYAQRYLKGSS